MPSSGLSRKDERALETRLNQAITAINQGYMAWELAGRACASKMAGESVEAIMRAAARQYPIKHIVAVSHAQGTIAAELARFEDGSGYNLDICHEHTLDPLAHYEEMASNLLEDIAALKGDRQEEAIRTPTGKWAMSRSLIIDGHTYCHAAVCTNPAVGVAHLDRWEQDLRAGAIIGCEPERSSI